MTISCKKCWTKQDSQAAWEWTRRYQWDQGLKIPVQWAVNRTQNMWHLQLTIKTMAPKQLLQ